MRQAVGVCVVPVSATRLDAALRCGCSASVGAAVAVSNARSSIHGSSAVGAAGPDGVNGIAAGTNGRSSSSNVGAMGMDASTRVCEHDRVKLVAFVSLALLGCAGELTNTAPPGDADDSGMSDGPRWVDASTGPNVSGMLQITATSSPGGGPYAPRNVVAIWIMSPSGSFMKTIGRWADVRKQALVAWGAAAGPDTDAISGATRQDHATPLTVTWDMKTRGGQLVGNGTYTVRMESADSDANQASQNHQGTFTFLKSATPQTQTGLSNGGFSNVSITFTPTP
jgi:hypothetical protein